MVDYIKTHENTDSRVHNKHGATFLHHAARRAYSKLLELLFSLPQPGSRLDIRGSEGNPTPLLLAARWQKHKIIQVLIDAGSDVNAQNANHESAFFWAIKRHQPRLVELTVHKGAHIDPRARYGLTPSTLAIIEHHVDIVTLLLDSGASVTEPDRRGHRPLSWAIEVTSYPLRIFLFVMGLMPDNLMKMVKPLWKEKDQEILPLLRRH